MKKIFSIIMISLLSVAMLFTACKKDENNNNNGNSETPGGGGTEVKPDGTIENNVVTDIDGNVYNGVWLNGKLWMKENLRTTHFADGSDIPTPSNETFSAIHPYRYAPNNDESNVPLYGYLYNWPAAVYGPVSGGVVKGACPNGWHVPSTGEWEQMTEHLLQQEEYLCNGGLAAAMCATWAWEPMDDPHPCLPGTDLMSNNSTGFTALPAGAITDNANMLPLGYNAMFWTSTPTGDGDSEIAWSRSIGYTYWHIGSSSSDYKGNGYSVRCVRD